MGMTNKEIVSKALEYPLLLDGSLHDHGDDAFYVSYPVLRIGNGDSVNFDIKFTGNGTALLGYKYSSFLEEGLRAKCESVAESLCLDMPAGEHIGQCLLFREVETEVLDMAMLDFALDIVRFDGIIRYLDMYSDKHKALSNERELVILLDAVEFSEALGKTGGLKEDYGCLYRRDSENEFGRGIYAAIAVHDTPKGIESVLMLVDRDDDSVLDTIFDPQLGMTYVMFDDDSGADEPVKYTVRIEMGK